MKINNILYGNLIGNFCSICPGSVLVNGKIYIESGDAMVVIDPSHFYYLEELVDYYNACPDITYKIDPGMVKRKKKCAAKYTGKALSEEKLCSMLAELNPREKFKVVEISNEEKYVEASSLNLFLPTDMCVGGLTPSGKACIFGDLKDYVIHKSFEDVHSVAGNSPTKIFYSIKERYFVKDSSLSEKLKGVLLAGACGLAACSAVLIDRKPMNKVAESFSTVKTWEDLSTNINSYDFSRRIVEGVRKIIKNIRGEIINISEQNSNEDQYSSGRGAK